MKNADPFLAGFREDVPAEGGLDLVIAIVGM
jgi:hypothetical protein